MKAVEQKVIEDTAEKKEKRSWLSNPFVIGIVCSAGTLLLTDINGWFLSRTFPIIIKIIGFQFSIGLSVLLTVFALVLMTLSGLAGFASFPLLIIKMFSPKTKLPLWIRVFFFVFYPVTWSIDIVDKIRRRNVKSGPPMTWEELQKSFSEVSFVPTPEAKKDASTPH